MSGQQRREVTDIRVSTANLVTLKLGRVTVVWGGASEPQLKVEVMTALAEAEGGPTGGRQRSPDPHHPITRDDTRRAMLNLRTEGHTVMPWHG